MLVIGYRGNVDWAKVKNAFKQYTNMDPSEIADITAKIKKGQTIGLEENFLLRYELKDLGILLR